MTTTEAPDAGFAEKAAELLKGLDKTHVGAAMSKLISASIGDIAMVFSRSPHHKHYTFADLEWMIAPAVMTGQFYVAEVQHPELGTRAPVAAVLWASVSDETDQRLSGHPTHRIRLRPDEWQAGPHVWIVDVAGEQASIGKALMALAGATFKGKIVKVSTQSPAGGPQIELLHDVMGRTANNSTARPA
jgi:hemolysin-activating ACP:hemolysin acyltransferase